MRACACACASGGGPACDRCGQRGHGEDQERGESGLLCGCMCVWGFGGRGGLLAGVLGPPCSDEISIVVLTMCTYLCVSVLQAERALEAGSHAVQAVQVRGHHAHVRTSTHLLMWLYEPMCRRTG
jgi:hypothetical protein